MSEQLTNIDSLLNKFEFVEQFTEQNNLYYINKRIFDLIISTIALLLLSPLMLVIAILVCLDSSGPAIYVQKRVGARRRKQGAFYIWEKRIFNFYKFRTMVNNNDPSIHQAYIKALIENNAKQIADIQGGESQTKKLVHDSRITRLGGILRKTSLDELPQFFNVLKGEMSLVGPRPAIPYEVEMYQPWYFRRLDTLPGMTGLWQVEARSNVGFEEMIKFDLEYIQKKSFWFDMKILIKTPIVVLSAKGAS